MAEGELLYNMRNTPCALVFLPSYVGKSTGKVKNAGSGFITEKRAHPSLYNLNFLKVLSSYQDEPHEVFRDARKNNLEDILQTD